MNAAPAIRRLEEAGFTHQQATGVAVIDEVATREYVGEQIALVRKELAEQIGAVRRELAGEAGGIRADLASLKVELMQAINRLTFWMNGFLAAVLVAVLGLCGILIGKL